MRHRWSLPGNYPDFTVVMAIYRYVERIGEFLLPPIFSNNIYDNEKNYPYEPVNMNIVSLINIIQDNNRIINAKKG